MLRYYELFLARRYLRKKRLAFFSVAAVALSVTMLIVVASVMGGYVEQFRTAYHGFYGDIIVRSDSLLGFPYYEEFISRAQKLDGVQAATAVIKQFGLLRIDQQGKYKLFVKDIDILGIKPESYSKITKFKDSLWKQSSRVEPATLKLPKELAQIPRIKGACIVGIRVPYNPSAEGGYDRINDLYNSPVSLTTVPLKHTGVLDVGRVSYNFILIDDSETFMPIVDERTVYIDFDIAQKMLRMLEYTDDKNRLHPARTSEVRVRLVPGTDSTEMRDKLRIIWQGIADEKVYRQSPVIVETCDEYGPIYRLISQLKRDRTLMTILFAIMGVVSIFLIFCIFFVIVTEKIPDIGIIKSVGGTSTGVGHIFLIYGGAVGLVGALLGLAMAWPFVVNINAIHTWVGQTFGWKVYDPSVLLFPHIPNTMDWHATKIIMIATLAGSLIGSLIPAARAAVIAPIKALRYE